MLKRVHIVLLALVTAIAVTSCTGEPAPSVEPTDRGSQSTEPSEIVSPSAVPMSYEDYFSEIRTLESGSSYYTTLPNNHDGEDLCRQEDESIVVQDIFFSGDQPPLFWEFAPEGNVAYSVDAHKIYRYNDNDGVTTLLYDAGEEVIAHFVSDQNVLFVLVGTEIRRVYLPTGKEDFIIDKAYVATDGVHFGQVNDSGTFEAKTNCQVMFGVTDYNWYAEAAKDVGVTLDEYINGWYQDIGGTVFYNTFYDVFASNEPRALELLGIPADKQVSIHEYIELVGDNY